MQRLIDRADLVDAQGNSLTGYYVTEHFVDRATGRPNAVVANGPAGPGTTTESPDPNTGYSGFTDLIGGLGSFDLLQTFTASATPPSQPGENTPIYIIDNHDKAYGTNGIYINRGVYVNGDISEPPCH